MSQIANLLPAASRTIFLFAVALLITGCQSHPFNTPKNTAAAPVKKLNDKVLTYKLEDLNYRTADHLTPDAIVYVAKGFDSEKPIHLIVYNHGMMNDLNQAHDIWTMEKHMEYASPNTVLVMPEWAKVPSELSLNAGPFYKPGFFRNMLTEILSKVPELANTKLESLKDISIASFSGGWRPSMAEIYDNGLEDQITGLFLFDSLYKGNGFDRWLEKNIKQLASGEKQYHNYFFHTYPQSFSQMRRVQKMLTASAVQNPLILRDTIRQHEVLPAQKIAKYSIVYKNTMLSDEKFTGHQAAAQVYLPEVLKSLSIRQAQGQTQVASTGKNPV
jgi:hypothetical protein